MADLFKKILYTGVGLVSVAAEKVQKNIDEMVKKGSLTEEEGKKMVDDLVETTEEQAKDFETKLKETVSGVMKTLKFPTLKDLTALKKRIEALEAQLGIEVTDHVEEAAENVKAATQKVKKAAKKVAAEANEAKEEAKVVVKKATVKTKQLVEEVVEDLTK